MSTKTTIKQEGSSFVIRRNMRIYRPNNFVRKVRTLTSQGVLKIQELKQKKVQVKRLKYYLKKRILKTEKVTQNRLCGVFWEKELRNRGGGEIYLLGYEWVPTRQEMNWWKNFNSNRVKLE